MCTIFLSWQQHPQFDLIVAANRDEYYRRPTTPAHYWQDAPHVFAGRDDIGRGTWMGATTNRRFAALTNFRNLDAISNNAPSRGGLTSDFLNSTTSPQDYLANIQRENLNHNPYNLLVGDKDTLCYYSNMSKKIIHLEPGIYGLSNGYLDAPWPKVTEGKKEFIQALNMPSQDKLLGILQNKAVAADNLLPKTGVPYGMEKALSALFIELAGYGTRCSTIIMRNKKETLFTEKSYPLETQVERLITEMILTT